FAIVYIFFDDDCVSNAAIRVIVGIFAAAGQTCIAGSRVFAHRAIYEELLERVAERAQSIKMGDPMEDTTELGPLAFEKKLEKVRQYVKLGVTAGATVYSGGDAPEVALPGYYYSPTVLTDVNNKMYVVREAII